MTKQSKRMKLATQGLSVEKRYSIAEAVELLKQTPPTKFDQTFDISLQMGVDPKKSDQQVRGTISLPNGTGKTPTVLVFAKGPKMDEATEAGADFVGHDDLIAKVSGGWTDFDNVVTTPDMMREVGRLGKVLGPRGLMPTPKAGTVTTDIAKAVAELKAGKIEFKLDRHGSINTIAGKISFEASALVENVKALVTAIVRVKPASAKGNYIESVVLSTTMGPGLKIDSREIQTL